MVKKGDTLVEVTLAIGIFSMIAVSVTAVMNGSTSGSQANLETTLTREQVDIQAEALRFIHSSYSASQDNADTRYKDLWNEITKNAVKLSELKDNDQADLLEYQPTSCAQIYKGDKSILEKYKPFAIDPVALSNYANAEKPPQASRVLFSGSELMPADTYPQVSNTARGIYIIAVPDVNTTELIGTENTQAQGKPAFYDFYIRTCWYGTDADNPSTISTVVRLYNPDAVVARTPQPKTEDDDSDQGSDPDEDFDSDSGQDSGQSTPTVQHLSFCESNRRVIFNWKTFGFSIRIFESEIPRDNIDNSMIMINNHVLQTANWAADNKSPIRSFYNLYFRNLSNIALINRMNEIVIRDGEHSWRCTILLKDS